MGYWSQSFCPGGMSFDFMTQACKYSSQVPTVHENTVRKEDLLNIGNLDFIICFDTINLAILNGSCINGEQCIGGTVCDASEKRCLCPYDTIANLETLSCVPSSNNLHEESNGQHAEMAEKTARPGKLYLNLLTIIFR
jgi:hypothetical protein